MEISMLDKLAKVSCLRTFKEAEINITKHEKIIINQIYQGLLSQNNVVIDSTMPSKIAQEEFYIRALEQYVQTRTATSLS